MIVQVAPYERPALSKAYLLPEGMFYKWVYLPAQRIELRISSMSERYQFQATDKMVALDCHATCVPFDKPCEASLSGFGTHPQV